jgi:hypothetical protein
MQSHLMKKYIFNVTLLLLFCSSVLSAQISRTNWKLSTKKINDCEYDLIFTVKIQKGWHLYSIEKVKGAEMEVPNTEILFEKAKGFILVGGLIESKPKAEYDPTINKTTFIHENLVIFKQRIKLITTENVTIKGTYEYQVCSNGVCSKAPYEEFSFNLKGSSVCTDEKK